MEDWEALAYEDDFESRYADELELLNELDGQFILIQFYLKIIKILIVL